MGVNRPQLLRDLRPAVELDPGRGEVGRVCLEPPQDLDVLRVEAGAVEIPGMVGEPLPGPFLILHQQRQSARGRFMRREAPAFVPTHQHESPGMPVQVREG